MNTTPEDPGWRRSCQSLTGSLKSLQKKASNIRRSTKKIVSTADIAREREKIGECTRSAKNYDVVAIEEALRKMQLFMQLYPSFGAEGAKLMKDAQETVQEYQQVCDAFYRTCLEVEERSRRTRLQGMEDDDDDEDDESNALLESNRQTYARNVEQQLHDEMVAELERETNEISENVRDVNIIFRHIAQLVQEQGVQLDTVDENLMTASRATHNGTQQLERARNHQLSSTGTKWMVIAVLVLTVFITLHLLAK